MNKLGHLSSTRNLSLRSVSSVSKLASSSPLLVRIDSEMPPKRKAVDALPRTPRKNAREPAPDNTDDGDGVGANTVGGNAAFGRVRDGSDLSPSLDANGL
jgi:hypothetical protein